MSLRVTKGCLLLEDVKVPPELAEQAPPPWRAARERRDGPTHHLTVLPPTEKAAVRAAAQLQQKGELLLPQSVADPPYYLLGVVVRGAVAFAPCLCPAAQALRAQLGLAPSDGLHVTIGFDGGDQHDVDKSFRALTAQSAFHFADVQRLLRDGPPAEVVAHLHGLAASVPALQALPELHKAYVLHCCHTRAAKVAALQEMVAAGHVGGGLLALHRLREDITGPLRALQECRCDSRAHAQTLADLYNAQKVPKRYAVVEAEGTTLRVLVAPPNFSAVADGVYGGGITQSKHAPLLQALRITTVVNLMETAESSLASMPGLRYVHVPVDDQTPPTAQQVAQVLALLDPAARPVDAHGAREGVLVHCLGGKGRTAFVLLCYLMSHGGQTLAEAHTALGDRETILSAAQKEALRERQDRYEREQPKGAGVDRSAALQCDAIIMMGLPGAGKSTLAKHLAAHCARVVRVSQDEMGRRDAEAALSHVRLTQIALIDRCNVTAAERAEWRPARARRVLCIFLDTPPEVATYRVKHRQQHETLQAGAATRVVEKLRDELEVPDAAREDFCEVLRLSTEAAVAHQVAAWGLPPLQPPPLAAPTIVKFPRTRHLVNLGAATRDDLVLSQADVASFLRVPIWVEEKVDGANMGFSIDPATFEVIAQNRSHVVSSGYHAQFGKLTPWLSQHSNELYQLLEPGREVLYGEWVVAQHSIPYARLPDYFIAFDLYDKVTETFLGRDELAARLAATTTIPLIHLIATGTYDQIGDIVQLASSRSVYYDGTVEGVYVRRCEGGHTVDRAKIVRNDFIAGNDHWTKKNITFNKIVPPQ